MSLLKVTFCDLDGIVEVALCKQFIDRRILILLLHHLRFSLVVVTVKLHISVSSLC